MSRPGSRRPEDGTQPGGAGRGSSLAGLADAAVRLRAVEDLDRSMLVEAPAGSGKTTLLVGRILAWVRSGRAPLPAIVAITFTEKAATELRLRVREALEAERAAAVGPVRTRLQAALAELELAPIRTIHGFCADLLRQRPVEAGIDPGFAVADPLETALLAAETWERWLEAEGAAVPDAVQEVVALGVPVERLAELARALAAERDLLAGLPVPTEEPPPALARDVRARLLAVAEAAPTGPRADRDRLVRALRELAARLRETAALPEAEQLGVVLTELDLRSLADAGARAVWGAERRDAARTTLADLAGRLDAARARRFHNLTAAVAQWLAGYVAAYRARLRRLGLLDFHDLLAVTRDLLRDRPDVRRDLQARYRTLLVDEFQDTDPLQLEIAFLLAEDPAGPPAVNWSEVRLGPGRLFLVGDPKQSIYRFRRADIETYARARAILAAQGEVLALTTNFRSGARLLAAVNHLFAEQMQPPPDGDYQPPYAPVTPAPDAPDGEGPLLLEGPPTPEAPPEVAPAPGDPRPGRTRPGSRLEARREAEAAALARLVAEAVGEGRWPVRDPRRGDVRPARYGDVVCLFRTLGGAGVYEDAFRAAGVPYRTLGGGAYYARSEVGWALAALTAIEDPHDPVALVAALRSPFFGVPDGALLALQAAGGRLCYLAPLPAGVDPALEEAWQVLRELHARRVEDSAAAVVEALYAATEVLAAYAPEVHGEQRLANLLRIVDTARALEARGRPTFRALVRWLRAQGAGGYEESESPLAEEGDQVVRLMTVHAAKGLEFPVVILPDLAWDRRPGTPLCLVDRRPDRPALAITLGTVQDWPLATENHAALLEAEARRAEAEALRLFYVATTRARDHLVLPLLFDGPPQGFARFCAPLCDPAWTGARRQAVRPAAPGPAAGPPSGAPPARP